MRCMLHAEVTRQESAPFSEVVHGVQFLRTGLSIGNCLHTLVLAAQYDCHELFESAVSNQDQLYFLYGRLCVTLYSMLC